MKKGDCILLNYKDENNVLILHHSIIENGNRYYGFLIVGQKFDKIPSKEEIEANGVLGYRYLDDKTDLANTIMISSQKLDKSILYTRVKYDVILIDDEVSKEIEVKKIAHIELNPDFNPMPNFYSRQKNYDEICELIENRIAKKGKKTTHQNTIYESHPVVEILMKKEASS